MMSAWAPFTNPITPSQMPTRQSHDQDRRGAHSPADEAQEQRRSSSDATPRPTPAVNQKILANASAQDSSPSLLGSTPSDAPSTSKRLGFFTDKFSSSTSTQRGAAQLLHPHNHSRAESSLSQLSRDGTASPSSLPMASSLSSAGTNKPHTSPSKASYGRTYDSKLVSREMHRLGNLTHIPAAFIPTPSTTPSASPLSLPASGSTASTASTSSTDPWGALHVHVLPLFNGEPLRVPIEDLNVLVKRHIQTVVSSSPSKALATLEQDASELIASGMVTLNAKLMGVDDDKLIGRVVQTWGFFWDSVLTYVEGVLLPLQTDNLLQSLYRTPKTHHRSSSPGRQNTKGSISSSISLQMSAYHIDVRTVALRSFRDKVILPLAPRLYSRLPPAGKQDALEDLLTYQQPRLQQMLLVLASQSSQRPSTFSLTAPAPQPTPGESVVSNLLRIVRHTQPQSQAHRTQKTQVLSGQSLPAPTFLSGGQPRDRRGRIAHKQKGIPRGDEDGVDEDVFGDGAETPRIGFGHMVDREREREFLEALKSPELEITAARASVGGWGLGGGHEDSGKVEDDEEDEITDWDQAQADVERMIGMKPADLSPEQRRRIT